MQRLGRHLKKEHQVFLQGLVDVENQELVMGLTCPVL